MLVSPRNPLNIGAVARAMANFGFEHLSVAAPYTPHWREAKSAVGAPELLANASEFGTIADAVARCTFVAGTGSLAYRKPEQPVVSLPDLAPLMQRELANGGRAALVFGPEKHGLTREDLSYCHVLVEIPTDARQPSMNLGQAAAVCLYELARPISDAEAMQGQAHGLPSFRQNAAERMEYSRIDEPEAVGKATSQSLDRLASLIEEVMLASNYSPETMHDANRHDLRLLLRRLKPNAHDTRRMMGLFRRILRRLVSPEKTG